MLSIEAVHNVARVRAFIGEDLERAVEQIERDGRFRSAVIFPRADARELAKRILRARTTSEAEALARDLRRSVDRLAESKKPFVAAIEGPCLGAAFEVALASAARVAVDERGVEVGFPEVRLGLLPALGGLERLSAIVGAEEALTLATSGGSLRARLARRKGIVDVAVPRAVLFEVAASMSDALVYRARPRRTESFARRAWSRWSMKRAGAAFGRGHEPAPQRIAGVLEALFARGEGAAREEALRVFGELSMTAVAQRSVEVFLDELAHAEALGGRLQPLDRAQFYRARLLHAYVREADFLIAEGASPSAIDAALVAWGFPRGPASMLEALGRAEVERGFGQLREALGDRWQLASMRSDRPSRRLAVEEMQMRVALAVVDEAIRAFGEGVVASAREADLGAIAALGFPRFRGGPLRYVDALGAAEALARMSWLASHWGARFEPAEGLREKARVGGRFHEPVR